jgi:hypothetical protein
MYTSIEEFKKECMIFPKGKIIPNRIIKLKPRKKKFLIKASGDLWLKPLRDGTLIVYGKSMFALSYVKNLHLIFQNFVFINDNDEHKSLTLINNLIKK